MSKIVLFQTIQLSINTFLFTHSYILKTVLFQVIQISSIRDIDKILSCGAPPDQSEIGSKGNKRGMHIN